MRNLFNPKWLLLTNTLPVIILFIVFFGEYSIIKSLLKSENIYLWKQFAYALGTFGILTLSYLILAIIKKWRVSYLYAASSLLYAIAIIYMYCYNDAYIIPNTIPRWMVSSEMGIYVITFLMPGMLYSIMIFVIGYTSAKNNNLWSSIGIAFIIPFSIPFLWYLSSQIFLPLFNTVEDGFAIHTVLIFSIFLIILFLFFLIRVIYILIQKRYDKWNGYEWIWKIPIVLLLPLTGLYINNGSTFGSSNHDSEIIADFSSNWFFILCILNAVILYLPKSSKRYLRLILFFGKSITLSFTLYFFLVFLPFLPIGIIAILAIGIGFLLLAPLLLFILHIKELSDDFLFLIRHFSKQKIIIVMLGGIIVIPTVLTVNNLYHKRILNEALDYVYNPDYTKSYDIDANAVANTLTVIDSQKEHNRNPFSGNSTPYLSSYFNWIVLNNMTLSDTKINDLKTIFLGQNTIRPNYLTQNQEIGNEVKIKSIKTSTHYDAQQQYWRTKVDFEIENYSEESWNKQFSTNFELPVGCWISNYYLYIGSKKENGLLVEKKAAKWVFSQIVNENRDPGILYYLNDKEIAFNIFPFTAHEIRKTGIEFIHKETIDITIGGKTIHLGDNDVSVFSEPVKEDNKVIYVSASVKRKLPHVARTPYYCFIVDISKGKEKLKAQYTNQIERLLQSGPASKSEAQICFTNTYSSIEKIDTNWKHQMDILSYEGGFYLDRAVKKVLFQNYTKKEKRYPVMVVLTDKLQHAIINNDMSGFKATFPESDLFYTIASDGKLKAHSLVQNPVEVIESSTFETGNIVLAYPNAEKPIAYLADNGKADIVLREPIFDIKPVSINEQWESGLQLQGQWLSQILYPEKTGDNWINAIKESFRSKIMTAQTSYIVVENNAQKAMLLKKQQQVLSGNKALDLDEENANRMSEPNLLVLLALLTAIILLRKYQNILFKYSKKQSSL